MISADLQHKIDELVFHDPVVNASFNAHRHENLSDADRLAHVVLNLAEAKAALQAELRAALAATAPTVAVDEPTFLDIMGMVRAQMHRVYASAIDREDIDSKHMAEIEAAIRGLAARAKLSEGVAIPAHIGMSQVGVGESAHGYVRGWNDCVDAMAAPSPDQQGE